jgi:acetyltransferase-like isoleucine patch superfamily enzyme
MNSIMLKIRRGETPFYRRLRSTAGRVRSSTLPLPKFANPLLRFGFAVQQNFLQGLRWALSYFFYQPLFRGRCLTVGTRFHVWRMPFVVGHASISIGNDVNFFGKVDVFSGRQFEEPRLVLGDRVDIGHNVVFLVNKEIVIEDDVNVASGVRFMDSDAHPRDTMARIADLPAPPEEIKPVHICRYAWIGQNSFIMKGVTIGEGAIVGVNSVVVNDIPAYSVAMGNPARVVVKNINKTAEAIQAQVTQEQRQFHSPASGAKAE